MPVLPTPLYYHILSEQGDGSFVHLPLHQIKTGLRDHPGPFLLNIQFFIQNISGDPVHYHRCGTVEQYVHYRPVNVRYKNTIRSEQIISLAKFQPF